MANKQGMLNQILQKYPDAVNMSLCSDTTNPMCRAAFLGYRNIAAILLQKGGDVNLKSSDGRTPLHWACFRNNVSMIEFLLDHGADTSVESYDNLTPIDLAITKMNYKAALCLFNKGIQPKDIEFYRGKCFNNFDIDLFFELMHTNVPEVENQRFFDK